MKNKQNNSAFYRFFVITDKENTIITLQYSDAGHVTAFLGYSDIVIGKANGGGYDKIGAALGEAVEHVTGKDYGQFYSTIRENAQKDNVIVMQDTDMCWAYVTDHAKHDPKHKAMMLVDELAKTLPDKQYHDMYRTINSLRAQITKM